MAKKRHYSSGSANHHSDHFNEEHKHNKDHGERGMYHKGLTSTEMYAGMEPRRRQELEDSYMIHEDHAAIANLPQNVMIKSYPKTGPYMPEMLNDDVSGVDAQMDYDDSQRRRHMYPKKV